MVVDPEVQCCRLLEINEHSLAGPLNIFRLKINLNLEQLEFELEPPIFTSTSSNSGC